MVHISDRTPDPVTAVLCAVAVQKVPAPPYHYHSQFYVLIGLY